METIESQKRKSMLLVDGYRYQKDQANADGSISWRCYEYDGCHRKLKMLQSEVISVTDHNHGPEPEINEVTKVQSVILKRALAGVEKPRQIILHARTGIPLEAVPHLPPYSASQRTINRQRKKKQMSYSSPKTVADIVIPEILTRSTRGENFVLWNSGCHDENRIFMFGTEENINRLHLHDHWFVDGTFKIAGGTVPSVGRLRFGRGHAGLLPCPLPGNTPPICSSVGVVFEVVDSVAP